MKTILKLCGSTLFVAFALAACAGPAEVEEEADEGVSTDQALRRRVPDEPVRSPERKPALTAGECMGLGGTIAHDSTCPQTKWEGTTGGKLVGTFSCTVGANTKCVNESGFK